MASSNAAWGIEIGSFAIKAIRLERLGDDVRVTDFAYVPHKKPLSTPDTDVEEMTRITLGQLMALRLGRLKDAGNLTPNQVSMGKRNNVHIALEATRIIRDMLGANGISLEYQVGRHMCNLESVYTYEGTHDIHTLAIGHGLTGIPAYR